jgi:hypothetical protein
MRIARAPQNIAKNTGILERGKVKSFICFSEFPYIRILVDEVSQLLSLPPTATAVAMWLFHQFSH